MSISLSQVRSAVASQVSSVAGFSQVKFPAEYFGRIENSIAHKGFSVSVSRSTAVGDRQRISEGIYTITDVVVIFGYRLRPKDIYPTDYDLCLDSEEEIIKKVLSSYSSIRAGTQIVYNGSNRSIPDSLEYMITQMEFTAYHHIGA